MPNKNKCFGRNDATIGWRERVRLPPTEKYQQKKFVDKENAARSLNINEVNRYLHQIIGAPETMELWTARSESVDGNHDRKHELFPVAQLLNALSRENIELGTRLVHAVQQAAYQIAWDKNYLSRG